LRNAAFGTVKWRFHDILTALHREEVLGLAKDKAGSSLFIGSYKKALVEFLETLTEGQYDRYLATAKEWMEKGLPVDMKRRYVHGSDFSRL
jgi:hypothetical protein